MRKDDGDEMEHLHTAVCTEWWWWSVRLGISGAFRALNVVICMYRLFCYDGNFDNYMFNRFSVSNRLDMACAPLDGVEVC